MKRIAILFVVSASITADRATAQAPASTQPSTRPAPLASHYAPLVLDSPYATGDWWGLRTAGEDAGINTQFFYNNTYQWNVKGGLDTLGKNGATIDWFITTDLQKLKLIPGGSLLVHVRRQWGEGVNPYTGSLWQVADDLDDDKTLHIDQLYYEQRLIDDKISLKTGFLDYQTIVDRNAYANAEDVQLLNQQFDNNPLVPLNIGLGAVLTIKPTSWLTLLAGAGDADSVLFKPGFSTAFHGPARFIWYLEPGINITLPPLLGKGKLPGSYRFGMVSDPRVKPIFVPPDTNPALRTYRGDDQGFYLSFDQALIRENDRDAQGLGIFARYGFRHGDINQVANFWSTGLSYQGLIPTRDRDVLGVAVGQSIPSRTYNDKVNRWAEAETVGELYYSISVTRWLVVTPDIQYVSSPGIGSGVDDAIVLGVRTRISF